jgi:hypothetical protein
VVAGIALFVLVLTNMGHLTGTMTAVLQWVGVVLACLGIAVLGVIAIVQVHTRLIVKRNPAVPAFIAVCAGAIAGAWGDIVSTTSERILLAVWLGILGFIGSDVYSKNKLLSSILFLMVPGTLVVVFFSEPAKSRANWEHQQGHAGWIFLALTVALLVAAFIVVARFDKPEPTH